MDTKALRQKILDLAIRGKLVPQDPNDEPASVLLERIRAEKQQMVKDGKLKPKDIKNDTIIFVGEDNLHYEKFQDGSVKCIEDEIPFELPEGWEWCRVRDIAAVKGGKRLPKGVGFSPCRTAHAYIRVTDMKNHSINTDDLKCISEEVFLQIKNYTISKDDLYVTIAGTIGVTGEVPTELDGMNLTENAVKITNIQINKTYLCLIIQSEFVQQQFQDKTHQVAMPKLALERILSTLIPVCTITTQSAMVSKFVEMDSLINQIREEKEILAETVSLTKSKILDLAIRGKLVPQNPDDEPASVLLERIRAEKEELIKQGKIKRDKKESVIFKGEDNSYYEKVGKVIKNIDDEIPFTIPDSWKWCRLKAICKKIVDGSHNPPKGLDFVTPYIMASSRNIIENTISDLSNVRYLNKENFIKEHSRTNVEINDILLTTVATLGRSCIYKGKPENLCFQRSVTIITSCILPTYLKLFFDAPYFQNFIVKSATGTAQKGFYLNQLENVLICIPPLAEQDKISCGISSIFYYLDLIEKSLN